MDVHLKIASLVNFKGNVESFYFEMRENSSKWGLKVRDSSFGDKLFKDHSQSQIKGYLNSQQLMHIFHYAERLNIKHQT